MKESLIQAAILDYLAARHILAFRMNTGAVKLDRRFLRFGVPGMADILAFSVRKQTYATRESDVFICPLWIECKAERGVQSEPQKSFQDQVEGHGHRYIIAQSIDDVEMALKSAGQL